MQEELEQEEQLSIAQSPAAIVTLLSLSILFLGAIIFFGYQTWLFVNWLLPEDSLMMKFLAVINFDVFSYVWLAVGLFLARWIQPLTRTLAVIAGIVTFILSLGCSVIQMTIASAERFGVNTNQNLVYTADGFIIVALVWNICTLLAIIHIQWPSISGYRPPKRPKKRSWFQKTVTSPRTEVAIPPLIPNDAEVARLRRLAEFASKKGYSLDELESLLGVSPGRDTSPLPVTPQMNGADKKKRQQ